MALQTSLLSSGKTSRFYQGYIKVSSKKVRTRIRTLRLRVSFNIGAIMKKAIKNTAARNYLASMAEAASATCGDVPRPKPRRIEGGCLLYMLPSKGQGRKPAPIYL
jgi:hypothetical protein